MKWLFIMALTCLTYGSQSRADEWRCDADIEVRCSEGECSVDGSFNVPLSLSFDEAGYVSFCAYSGCWEGRGDARLTEQFLFISAKKLGWSTPGKEDKTIDALIVLDMTDNVAIIKATYFATPFACKKHGPKAATQMKKG